MNYEYYELLDRIEDLAANSGGGSSNEYVKKADLLNELSFNVPKKITITYDDDIDLAPDETDTIYWSAIVEPVVVPARVTGKYKINVSTWM